MGNHIHLIVEAPDRKALTRGMQGLGVRIARALNRVMKRHGRVVSDRYHAHILKTPSEVKRARHYLLTNARHHYGHTTRRRLHLQETGDRSAHVAADAHALVRCVRHTAFPLEHSRRESQSAAPATPVRSAPSLSRLVRASTAGCEGPRPVMARQRHALTPTLALGTTRSAQRTRLSSTSARRAPLTAGAGVPTCYRSPSTHRRSPPRVAPRRSPTPPATARAPCRRRRRRPATLVAPVRASRRCRARRARRRAARAGPRAPARRSPSPGARGRTGCRTRCPATSTSLRVRHAATRTASSARTRPVVAARGAVVITANSRSPPSSCDDDVRKTSGHCGHGLRSRALVGRARHQLERRDATRRPGGARCRRSRSRCRRRRARRRACRAARMRRAPSATRVAGDAAVLLRQELHREVHAGELAPGHRRDRAAACAPPREHDGVVLATQLVAGDVDAAVHAGLEVDALGRASARGAARAASFSSLKSGMP